MSIKSDRWIRRMVEAHGMIEPFEPSQVRYQAGGRVISFGTSSYGYDVRCADEFKIFTNINSTIVDPKAFDERNFVDLRADVCIIPPNSFALARTVEYFRIPRNVLTICLGKSTYARCFRGDTRVALVDGTAPTLEEMARRAEDGELFWGYSIGQLGRVRVALLDAPRFVGRDSLIELTLDNQQLIHCTHDHEIAMRDGRLVQAGELRPGDSLMPLYRHLARGYERVYQPANGHLYPTHRLADEWNLRNGIYPEEPGIHRHHKDHDRRNNCPWNIERMPASEHVRMHNALTYGKDFDPGEHGQWIRESFAQLAQDPAWRECYGRLQRERATRFWQDECYAQARDRLRLRHIQNWISERRQRRRDVMLAHYADPVARVRSIRGAVRLLNCDRAVFRRFPEAIAAYRGQAKTTRNHKIARVRELAGDHDVYCLTVPEDGNFALDAGVFVSNCGIIVNVTPLEPEWEGHVTLEFSNTTPLPAKIYAHEGVAQILFFESDEVCETSYKDRGGKYQGQRGVTLPHP